MYYNLVVLKTSDAELSIRIRIFCNEKFRLIEFGNYFFSQELELVSICMFRFTDFHGNQIFE